MSARKSFAQFGDMPLEIRQEIWKLSLGPPRVLQVVFDYKPEAYGVPPTFKVRPASYGGRHPTALSVSRESREVALRHLKCLHRAYWNLDTDVPYFEIRDEADDQVTALAEFQKAGHLNGFKHVAIDWKLWMWQTRTATMEFRCCYPRKFDAYKHPIYILNNMPNVQTCTFVYREHTLEQDYVIPFKPWRLGPLTAETTLEDDYLGLVPTAKEQIEERRTSLKRMNEIDIDFLAIHDREREHLPAEKRRRQIAVWQMDWFG